MKYVTLGLLLAGVSAPAFAADSADNEILVTASRIPLAAREVGSAVTIVTQEDIKESQAPFAKDLLQMIAGVQLTTDRPGDNTNVSIRGSDNDQVLFLIDGIELGDPSSTSTQYQSDHLVTRDIARIEVLRGNQSSLYGSDAIGGVVNIITQRATEEGISVNAEGEYGAHDTLNGGASILGKKGAVDFRLTATGYQHKGPSLADPATGSATERDEYWRYGFSGRLGVAATDNLELQLIGFWQDAHSDLDNTNSDSANTVRKREYAYAGQARYGSDDGHFHADLTASRYVARRLYFGNSYKPEGDLYKGTKDVVALNANYDSGSFVSVAAGVNKEWEKSDQVTNYSGNFDASVNTSAVYGELALRPLKNLTLTGAARVDDHSRFGSFDTYRATAAYLITDAMSAADIKLRASYGTGAKAPGLYQLFDPQYGNPNLEVETSKGGDVGFDLGFGQAFTAQFSYFFARVRNEIVFDGSIPPYGGYGQFGRTKKSGVEIGMTVRPTNWLSIAQSYTYLKAREDGDEDGVYLDMGRPKNSGSTAVTVTPYDGVSLTGRARYRSRNESSYGGATAGFAVFDLLGSYRLNDTVELYARVLNLFDKQYQMSFGKNTLGASAYGGVRLSF
ncbi:TonB-dependent receptor plug domain-containing protein [Sphingomonas sp. C3-2]|uniref:TonB-dependent receptor plug domain-containing protein n=1 Tax=Sphingomonas sp. C3-2 TaxID=3062169 RepID=UPI00294B1530|nr:TonB-dependent receptor [Sphingomonas sp. C3-2]WOK35208.1 TonB-dependent receptor [Sphingomonas sp. C3-2]